MTKYTYMALALAPMVCMTVQASPEVTAQDTIKAALTQLTARLDGAQDKDLPTLISELDAQLSASTPAIVQALEPLTNEQRLSVMQELMSAPELNALVAAAAPLSEGKAAAALMPTIIGEADPQELAATLPFKTKLQVIDIAANLLKICIGFGIDNPAVHGMFMPSMPGDGSGADTCDAEMGFEADEGDEPEAYESEYYQD